MRDSFVLYTSNMKHIEFLNMEQRGKLLTDLMLHSLGKEVIEEDGMVNMAFSYIKEQVENAWKSYDETCAKRSEAGKKGGRSRKQKKEAEDNIPYKEIIDYLNAKTGKNFSSASRNTRESIHARFAEGRTFEDFRKVIDNKVDEWKGTKMESYLRPITLFGSKFESYLNQEKVVNKEKTKFSNFKERDYDMDSLERELLNK